MPISEAQSAAVTIWWLPWIWDCIGPVPQIFSGNSVFVPHHAGFLVCHALLLAIQMLILLSLMAHSATLTSFRSRPATLYMASANTWRISSENLNEIAIAARAMVDLLYPTKAPSITESSSRKFDFASSSPLSRGVQASRGRRMIRCFAKARAVGGWTLQPSWERINISVASTCSGMKRPRDNSTRVDTRSGPCWGWKQSLLTLQCSLQERKSVLTARSWKVLVELIFSTEPEDRYRSRKDIDRATTSLSYPKWSTTWYDHSAILCLHSE